MAEPKAAHTGDQQAKAASRVPADIRNVSFPVAMRGYDRAAVDAYVRRANRVIAELEVTQSPQAAVRHAVERVSEQTKKVLDEARESGEQITATARAEADEIVGKAKTEAAELVVNAGDQADRVRAESEQLLADTRAESEKLLSDARAQAEQIVGEANAEAAERRRLSEEELGGLQAKAEAKMRELAADTDAVRQERKALLDDVEWMATRLHDAASAAAGRFTPEPEAPADDGWPTDGNETIALPPAPAAETLVDAAPASAPAKPKRAAGNRKKT